MPEPKSRLAISSSTLNGICPYFTMFPLDFPYGVLKDKAQAGDTVLDPFCGRGTTNYASRLLGLTSYGVDVSPVSVAVSEAKLANTTPERIVEAAARILHALPEPQEVPSGAFWDLAFHPDVLHTLCRLREGLVRDCRSEVRKGLRAVLLGGLHGPRPKSRPAYLSNQCQRTYAPKPAYAVRYWSERGLRPEKVDVLGLVESRAQRYYGQEKSRGAGHIVCGDSRQTESFDRLRLSQPVRWVITSPPFYGMKTYLQDQWLRYWLLGGPSTVDYSSVGQIAHSSPSVYVNQLQRVWANVAASCSPEAKLVVRFGGINDRRQDPLALIQQSLDGSGWRITQVADAGCAQDGRRQSSHIVRNQASPLMEYDVWAELGGSPLQAIPTGPCPAPTSSTNDDS